MWRQLCDISTKRPWVRDESDQGIEGDGGGRDCHGNCATALTSTQLAPLSLHEVLQVTLLPPMHALHTSTH
jgi:hypothetical protein